MIIIKNVVLTFVYDTNICSMIGRKLKDYQLIKHGWSDNQWTEYYNIYLGNIEKINLNL